MSEVEFPYTDDDGITYDNLDDYLMIKKLNFCGCGSPYKVLNLLHDFIEMLNKHRDKAPNISNADFSEYWKKVTDERKEFVTKNWEGVIWFIFYFLDYKNIFTHGGNVSGGWLDDDNFYQLLKRWKEENNER